MTTPPVTTPVTAGEPVRRWAAAVDAVPGVARRSGGGLVPVATHLPNERIIGLRAAGDRLEVHVVMTADVTVDELRDRVVAALAPEWPARAVDLVIDDIDLAVPAPVGRRPAISPPPEDSNP